jgi:hypothetical protein
MKVCPACGKKYKDEANFCPRATCASAGRPRRLTAVGVEIPEVARRLMKNFARKPGADDSPERLKAHSRERPHRSEEAALKAYLARLDLMSRSRALRASAATIDFLRYLLPETSRHRPEPGERLRDWDSRDAPVELQNLRHRAHAAIQAHLQRTAGDNRASEGPHRKRRTARSSRFQVRDPLAVKGMTATQQALHLAALLRAAGVTDVSSWPITGPDGADLLFSWHGKKVVIQTKGPEGPLTGKIVRQAQAAQASYGCQAVWVVAGGQFSPSVHAQAGEAGVLLLDGGQIADLQPIIDRQLRLLGAAGTRRR